jgi:REP element-mobilizing transposase RayT
MPYINIWIHAVWATKNRYPYLSKKIRKNIFQHIRKNAHEKGIHLDVVNGYTDHVHCLISMNATQSIATILNLIKGESSHWINKTKLTRKHFGWQEEYFVVSISPSNIGSIRNYILNQEKHHDMKTFEKEYQEYIEKYGFDNVYTNLDKTR